MQAFQPMVAIRSRRYSDEEEQSARSGTDSFSGATMRGIRTAFFVVIVIGLAWYGWTQRHAKIAAEHRANEAETALGRAASRVVFISFERAADLKVGSVNGKIAAQGGFDGYVFHPRQVTTALVTVEYFLPLASIGKAAYHWDAAAKLLTIDAPDVSVGVPNVDMVRSVTRQSGVFISREAGLAMTRQATRRISMTATATAKNAEHLKHARESGRDTLQKMAANTLTAVGIQGARVAVSFPWEPKVARDREHWDASRSITDVVGAH